MSHRHNVVSSVFILFLVLALAACGSGGGGGGDDGGGGGQPAAPANVAGTWQIDETIDNTACGRTGDTDSYQATVTQNGTSISVVTPVGTFGGSVNGNQVSWTGQYFDGSKGAWITITGMTLTVNGNTVQGSASWQFRDTETGPIICSGTTQVMGTRTSGGSSGADVSIAQLAGGWFGTLEDSAGDMHTVTVNISGSAITSIAIDGVPTYTGTISKQSAQVFSFVLNDSTEGGFFVDSTANYAAFLDEAFAFGVVQKGATTLPSYSVNDLLNLAQ